MAPATLASKPDVGTEAVHLPLASAARVGAAEADDVAEEQLEHGPAGHRPEITSIQSRGSPFAGRSVRSVAGIDSRSTGVTVSRASG